MPEIEAIATDVLREIEAAGLTSVIPAARATQLTMNREASGAWQPKPWGCRLRPIASRRAWRNCAPRSRAGSATPVSSNR